MKTNRRFFHGLATNPGGTEQDGDRALKRTLVLPWIKS